MVSIAAAPVGAAVLCQSNLAHEAHGAEGTKRRIALAHQLLSQTAPVSSTYTWAGERSLEVIPVGFASFWAKDINALG